jgi:hypothetical protein
MQYQAPYGSPGGPNDTTASYINGNPDTGVAGSCPPAAAIEYPQREIVNLITDAGAVAPNDADLHQLGKSIQSGKVNYGVDIGVVNAAIVPLVPIPDAYYGGMVVRFKAKFAPTAAATLDAGRGARSIVKSGGALLQGSEWSVGDIVVVTYDATINHWTLPPSSIAMLYAPRNFYVNGTTGSDSNDGLTAGTAFQTIQKAQNQTYLYNLNGYSVTINVADGIYTNAASPGCVVSCGANNGSGGIYFVGNVANPQNVQLTSSAGMAVQVGNGAVVSFNGFKLSSTGGAPGWSPSGVDIVSGYCELHAIEFGACPDYHIVLDAAARCSYQGPFAVSGSTTAHIFCAQSSYLRQPLNPPTLNIKNPINVSEWLLVAGGGVTFALYSTITGFGNVTGSKYNVQTNGVCYTNGSGINYYPGTIAGATSTGGQYA